MKSFEGYLKRKLGDSYTLLAGGGDYSLNNILHGDSYGTMEEVIGDCNSVDRTGIYSSSNFSNRPSGVSNWGTLFNLRLYSSSNVYHRQLFFDCYSSNKIWTRSKDGGTWTDWYQILTTKDWKAATGFDPDNYVTLNTALTITGTKTFSSTICFNDGWKTISFVRTNCGSGFVGGLDGAGLAFHHLSEDETLSIMMYLKAGDGLRVGGKLVSLEGHTHDYLPTTNPTVSEYLILSAYPGYGTGNCQIYYNLTDNLIRVNTASDLNLNGNKVWHAGNANRTDAAWKASSLSSYGSVNIYDSASSITYRLTLDSDGEVGHLFNYNTSDRTFSTLALNYGGGNVTIGTTSNTGGYKLHVNGTINATSTITQNGTAVSLVGHTHDYLPLTGGKLSLAAINSLTIYKTSNSSGFIYFTYNKNNTETPMGFLGVEGVNNPAFKTADELNTYTLLHQNNWSTYITKVAASGIADYLTTILDSNITACSSVDKTGVYSSASFSDRPSGVNNWGTLLNLRLYSSNNAYTRQLFFDCYDTNKIWARYNNANTWGDWARLILETDLPTATVGYAKAFPVVLTVTNDTPTVDLSSSVLNTGGLARNYSDTTKWVNGPSGLKYGTCLTISSGGGKSLSGQLLWDVNRNDANNKVTNNLYWRAADSSGWRNDWKRIAFASELGAYLPLSGGNLTGSLTLINSSSTNAYRYIRMLRGASSSSMNLLEFTIFSEKGLLIYNHLANGTVDKTGTLAITDTLTFNDNTVYHAGNSNKSDVSWVAANLTANYYLYLNAYPGYGTGSCSIYYNATNTLIRTNTATDLNLNGNKVWHAGNFTPGDYQLKSDTSGFTITNSAWAVPVAITRTGTGSGSLGGIDENGMYFSQTPSGGSMSYMYLKGGTGLTLTSGNFITDSSHGLKKGGSSNSKVLLGGGGDKNLSDFVGNVYVHNGLDTAGMLGLKQTFIGSATVHDILNFVAGSGINLTYTESAKVLSISTTLPSIAKVTSITNIGGYSIVYAEISASATLGITSKMSRGLSKTIIIKNTSASDVITITIPTSTNSSQVTWTSLDGSTLSIAPGKFLEISVLCYHHGGSSNTNRYYLVSAKGQ